MGTGWSLGHGEAGDIHPHSGDPEPPPQFWGHGPPTQMESVLSRTEWILFDFVFPPSHDITTGALVPAGLLPYKETVFALEVDHEPGLGCQEALGLVSGACLCSR